MSKSSLSCLFVVAGVLQLLLAPSAAWTSQKDMTAGSRKPFGKGAEKDSAIVPNAFQDMNRQISTFGFGCFLAAATSFAALGGPGPAFADAGKFSYDPSLGGPETWSNLNVEGNQCSGSKQSPIAIRPTACNVGANYEMKPGTCTTSNLEYTIGRNGPKASFPKDCSNTIRIPFVDGQFEAVQFHTHIGSEHTIGGKRFDSEFHIVHKQQGGNRFAVVGIMLNGDAAVDNVKFQRLLDNWDNVQAKTLEDCDGIPAPKKKRTVTEAFNPYELIPASSNFYHYDGSLTTPPCSEVVWWEVADIPLSISPRQLDRLVQYTQEYRDPKTCELDPSASAFDGTTNRPVAQDLKGRKVLRICPVNFFN